MKTWFRTISERERILLTAFLWLAGLTWLAFAGERAGELRRLRDSVTAEKNAQEAWLAQGERVERAAAEALKDLVPEDTLNATRLVGELNRLATENGVVISIDSPRTERARDFSHHAVTVTVRRADLASLLRFESGIQERSPYLGLEQVTLVADRSNPSMIDGRFRVFAVELEDAVQ